MPDSSSLTMHPANSLKLCNNLRQQIACQQPEKIIFPVQL